MANLFSALDFFSSAPLRKPRRHKRAKANYRSYRLAMEKLEDRRMLAVGTFERIDGLYETPSIDKPDISADIVLGGEALDDTDFENPAHDYIDDTPQHGEGEDFAIATYGDTASAGPYAYADAHGTISGQNLTQIGSLTPVPQITLSAISSTIAITDAPYLPEPDFINSSAEVDQSIYARSDYVFDDTTTGAKVFSGSIYMVGGGVGQQDNDETPHEFGAWSNQSTIHMQVWRNNDLIADVTVSGNSNGAGTFPGTYDYDIQANVRRYDSSFSTWVDVEYTLSDQSGANFYIDYETPLSDGDTITYTTQTNIITLEPHSYVPEPGISVDQYAGTFIDMQKNAIYSSYAGPSAEALFIESLVVYGQAISATESIGVATPTNDAPGPNNPTGAGTPDMDGDGSTVDFIDENAAWEAFISNGPTYAAGDVDGDGDIDADDDSRFTQLFAEWKSSFLRGDDLPTAGNELIIVSSLEDYSDGNYDFGDLSLSEALTLAADSNHPGQNTIAFSPHLFADGSGGTTSKTMVVADDFIIDSDVTLLGPGSDLLVIDSDYSERTFTIQTGVEASISGITMLNGRQTEGGIIRNAGDLLLNDVELALGAATLGGAIWNSGDITITDSVIKNNDAIRPTSTFGEGYGGGIYNDFGDLTISNTVISNNDAYAGGGIYSGTGVNDLYQVTLDSNNATVAGGIMAINGWLELDSTTVSRNTADTVAGMYLQEINVNAYNTTISTNSSVNGFAGIWAYAFQPRQMNFTNVTIANNTAGNTVDGAGIIATSANANVRLRNSIVYGNTNINGVSDVDGTFSSSSHYNLIGDLGVSTNLNSAVLTGSGIDAKLTALADHGGPTETHALRTGSDAIDAGNTYYSLTYPNDQRGSDRLEDGDGLGGNTVDLGAFELAFEEIGLYV